MKEMKDYVEELRKRHDEVTEVFADFPIKPTTTPAYTKFLEEHVVEIASRYVVLNTFEKPKKPVDENEVNARAGMTVAEVPAAPIKKDDDEVGMNKDGDDDIYYREKA
jgi:hypothetical protein